MTMDTGHAEATPAGAKVMVPFGFRAGYRPPHHYCSAWAVFYGCAAPQWPVISTVGRLDLPAWSTWGSQFRSAPLWAQIQHSALCASRPWQAKAGPTLGLTLTTEMVLCVESPAVQLACLSCA